MLVAYLRLVFGAAYLVPVKADVMEYSESQFPLGHKRRHSHHGHRERRHLRWKRAQKIAIRLSIAVFLILIAAAVAYVWMASGAS